MEYRLAEGAEIRPNGHGGGLLLTTDLGSLSLPCRDSIVRQALLQLAERPVNPRQLENELLESGSPEALAELYHSLGTLAESRSLIRELSLAGRVMGRMRPLAASAELCGAVIDPLASYQLSRFVVIRRGEEQQLLVENPLAHSRIEIVDAALGRLIVTLVAGAKPDALVAVIPNATDEEVAELLALLMAEGFLGKQNDQGQIAEDLDDTLRQWDAHDLYFHTRSRLGRHPDAVGGNFRFKGEIQPQPCVKPRPQGPTVPLFRPNLDRAQQTDPPFQAVIEGRRSIRSYGPTPITVEQLGAFLWRAARNRRYETTPAGEFTSRPYPSGGASYELEVYLTIDQCVGLEPGFYHYDPKEHLLVRLSDASEDTQATLHDAWRATAQLCWPQVLFTLAARFQRVSWKYDSMAYATILKNVGAVYQTFYLVATAMGLAPCGLGIGNSDRFCRLAGTDYRKETSVGEFALGSGPAPIIHGPNNHGRVS